MVKVRCIDVPTYIVALLSVKWCHTDAASRKRSHDEEPEGGPAVKKPASESHGETKHNVCIIFML